MRIAAVLGSVLLVIWTATTAVRADIVVFKVPTTNLKFILQGKAQSSRTLPTIYFTHLNKLIFDLPQTADTEVITLPTMNQIASKRLIKAKGDGAATREVAAWALEHGLIPDFHRAVDQLATIDGSDPFVVEVKRLKQELANPIAEDPPETVKAVLVPNSKGVQSNHFLMVYPENDKGADKSEIKKKKPELRLEQLEQLLEIFVMKCADRGLPVRIPTSRMRVIVSMGKTPNVPYGARTAPITSRIQWSQATNILYVSQINDLAPGVEGLRKLQLAVQKVQAQPRSRRNTPGQPGGASPGGIPGGGGTEATGGIDLAQLSLGQLSKLLLTLQSLTAIGTENFELEGISREAAYMFTANCDVVPPQAPYWVRDGLAAYFEFPEEMGWLKIGDLGRVRNAWYQASLQDPDRFDMTDIVTGRCHDNPVSAFESMRAGNMSWALMHFMLQTQPESLVKYLNSFRTMPPDLALDADILNSLFDDAVGEERSKLEESWREHMAGLKAEYLILKDDETAGTPTEN